MKPSWAKQEVYNYFDAFLQKSILNNDSYIIDNPGIFTIDNLNACVTAFVDNPDTGDRNFDAKSKDQFSRTSKEVQEVFAHFIWLWGMPASDMTSSGKKGTVIRFLGDEYEGIGVEGGNGPIHEVFQQNFSRMYRPHDVLDPAALSFSNSR